MVTPEFQCGNTMAALAKRSDANIVIPIERTRRGCGVFLKEPKIVIDDLIGFHSCLCNTNFHHPNMNNLMFLHDQFKNGVMPFKGSLTDQPSQIIEIFQLLDKLYQEKESEDHKKQQK